MIIGISGKIGSGKDTIAKIIQSLTDDTISEREVIELAKGELINPNPTWEIQKFAGIVKDIVCLLINCTREQLEDEKFKNLPLGKEWERWYFRLPNNADTNLRGQRISPIFNSEKEAKEYETVKRPFKVLLEKAELTSEILTPRKLFQLIGTECGRNIVHPNIWVNALMSKYKSENIQIATHFKEEGGHEVINNIKFPNWIISDVRFPNELKAIEDRGGFVIRVNRYPQTLIKSRSINEQEEISFDINNPTHKKLYEGEILKQHPSETALDNHNFDIVINNNGTIEELVEKVKQVLKSKSII